MRVIKADVGWRIDADGKTYYVGEFYEQGVIYKDDTAFNTGKGVCYVPEYGFNNAEQNGGELFEMIAKQAVSHDLCDNPYITTEGYTRRDFDDLVEDTGVDAEYLYQAVDWQSPETLLNELDY